MQNRTVKNEPEKREQEASAPKTMTLQVAETQKPMRIDVYLTQQVENVTRNKVQEAIAEQRVLVNGKPVKSYNYEQMKNFFKQAGKTVTLNMMRKSAVRKISLTLRELL